MFIAVSYVNSSSFSLRSSSKKLVESFQASSCNPKNWLFTELEEELGEYLDLVCLQRFQLNPSIHCFPKTLEHYNSRVLSEPNHESIYSPISLAQPSGD